jgi:hypothetical protein
MAALDLPRYSTTHAEVRLFLPGLSHNATKGRIRGIAEEYALRYFLASEICGN